VHQQLHGRQAPAQCGIVLNGLCQRHALLRAPLVALCARSSGKVQSLAESENFLLQALAVLGKHAQVALRGQWRGHL
jgi:hypothetical protein